MKYYTMKNKLNKSYYKLVAFSMLILIIIFETISIYQITNNTIEKFYRYEENLISGIKDKVSNLDTLSRKITNSNYILDGITNKLIKTNKISESNGIVSELFSQFILDVVEGARIAVYIKNNGYLYIGKDPFYMKFDETYLESDMYDNYFKKYNKDLLYCENNNNLELGHRIRNSVLFEENPYFMLVRKITYNGYQIIVETFFPYEDIQSLLNRTFFDQNKNMLKTTVFTDNDKRVIATNNDYMCFLDDSLIKYIDIKNIKFNCGKLYSFSYILGTNTSLIISIKASLMFRQTIYFISLSALAIIGMFFITKYVTKRISKSISVPINNLQKKLIQIDYNSLKKQKFKELDTDIQELKIFNEKYYEFIDKLNKAFDEVLKAQSYELHSRMLSLQTQMQPHFLYNTLSSIAAIAEESFDFEVKEACFKFAEMFRYIGNDEDATLLSEINHLQNYIDLLKLRFNKLKINIDINYKLYIIKVPKLIIQPLVENCIKHSQKNNCIVSIVGKIENDSWTISVKDNCGGFKKETLAEIEKKFIDFKNSNGKLRLSINGMGLLNIYARIKIYYGDNGIFKILNSDNGAEIIIGGKYDNKSIYC